MYFTNSDILPTSFSNSHLPLNQYSYSYTPNIVNVNQFTPPPRPIFTIPLNPSSSINIQQESNHINMYER